MAAAVGLVALLAVLGSLAWTDARRRVLPNAVVYPATAAALAAGPWLPAGGWSAAALGSGLLFAACVLLYALRPGALGAGDVKLAALLGAALGLPFAMAGMMLGSLAAAAVAVVMIARRRWTRRTHIAYGPYLACGAAVVALAATL